MSHTPRGDAIPTKGSPSPSAKEQTGPKRIRDILSEELFDGHEEVNIHHESLTYRLQKTSKGRLILIK